jgi:Mycothiol maleylpyruvate isomerase N-terminal domain
MDWTFDPAFIRSTYRSSAEALVATAGRIGDDDLDRPGLGEWTVRDVVGHASRALLTVETYLDAAEPGVVEPAEPLAYYAGLAASGHLDHAAILERGRAAGRDLGDQPADALAEITQRVLARIDAEPDDAPVATPAGRFRLVDYLPSRVVELAVHRLDLVAATGGDVDDSADRDGVALSLVMVAGLAGHRRDAATALLALTGRRDLPTGFSVV